MQMRVIKRGTAQRYLQRLSGYGVTQGSLLEIGCGDGDQLVEAELAGFRVTGIEYSPFAAEKARSKLKSGRVHVGDIHTVDLGDERFDVCIMADVIEHVRSPRACLARVWERLKPGGCLLVATPSLDSWSAKLMGGSWMELKPEHLSYFNRRTLESLLWQTGFEKVHFESGVKCVTLAYVDEHFRRYPSGAWSWLVNAATGLLPKGIRERPRYIAGSGMLALAVKGDRRERPLVSIIVPVYNEVGTVAELLEGVSRKQISGADKEVVVVESNSTDGSREVVLKFAERPSFRVLLEDQPRGKGAATRLGLQAARGDVVLIQDADLEYDLDDYESLLEPILAGREAFVLGARHGGGFWKMRQFQGQMLVSSVMNMAHWLFTLMINLCFATRLRDPFTMYKVFRRDAVAGLDFRCRRFDFDWELLILLLRKGYKPLEVPVNYRSRSYKDGKKVRFFSDPVTWVLTLCRLRLTKLPYRPGSQPGPRPSLVSGSTPLATTATQGEQQRLDSSADTEYCERRDF